MIYYIFPNAFIQTFINNFLIKSMQQLMLINPIINHPQLPVFSCTLCYTLPNYFFVVHAHKIVYDIEQKQLHRISNIEPISYFRPCNQLGMLYHSLFYNFFHLLMKYPLQQSVTNIILNLFLNTHQNLISIGLIFYVSDAFENELACLSVYYIRDNQICERFSKQVLFQFNRIYFSTHQKSTNKGLHFSQSWQSQFHHQFLYLFVLSDCSFDGFFWKFLWSHWAEVIERSGPCNSKKRSITRLFVVHLFLIIRF